MPGSDFASYRWGNTVDPITPGLMDRPYVARELIPWGSPATADLLNALDRRIQEGTLDPAGFAAIARRMGVGDVVLRNDLAVRALQPGPAARGQPRVRISAGPRCGSRLRHAAVLHAHEALRRRDRAGGAGRTKLRSRRSSCIRSPIRRRSCAASRPSDALMIAGDGEGLVDAADVGLLDGAGIVQYSGSYESPEQLQRRGRRRHDARAHRHESAAGPPLELGARQPRRHRTSR